MNLCKSDSCANGGTCLPSDIRISEDKITCICQDGYWGVKCELKETQIDINFREIILPSFLLVHFIEVFDKDEVKPHIRSTVIKKLDIYQESIRIYRNSPFHIMFVQFDNKSYLTILQKKYFSSVQISTNVNPSRRCLSINELFNSSIVNMHLIRRIKYYHIPCQKRSDLVCFYDNDQICLCDLQYNANCFTFDHNMSYNCKGVNYCENGGDCFQDHSNCPTASKCSCSECYYGSRCQFSSKSSILSLDIILGYHILPNVTFISQPLIIKISATISMIIVILGLISSILSIITFQNNIAQKIGTTIYILILSYISLLSMIGFTWKFWILIFSQMNLIINRTFIKINCRSIDFIIRIIFIIFDWLNVCVAIERVITVIKGINFNKFKSKKSAKWIILFVILFSICTSIHEVLYHNLINDEEEERYWCITIYSQSIERFNSMIMSFHFLFPFLINLISSITIIIVSSRQRSKVQIQQSYKEHLRKSISKHKHLLISPCVLVILSIPRLVYSFYSDCMKSPREPWIHLIGYFISFIPPILVFPIFVLPSDVYTKQFKQAIKRFQCNIYRNNS